MSIYTCGFDPNLDVSGELVETVLKLSDSSRDGQVLVHILHIDHEATNDLGVDLLDEGECVALRNMRLEVLLDALKLLLGEWLGRGDSSNDLLVVAAHELAVSIDDLIELKELAVNIELLKELSGGLVSTDVSSKVLHECLTALLR